MPSLSKPMLHSRILEAVGLPVEVVPDLREIPLRLSLEGIGELAFYAFTMTAPSGGRPVGEYKIQLILPGQARGTRGHLDVVTGFFTIIIGWSEDDEVFALWDGYAYSSFAYSRNLQVKGEAVWRAQLNGLSTCERRLRRAEGVETVVLCRKDRMLEGIYERMRCSAQRI